MRDGVISALLRSDEPSVRSKTRHVLGENPRSRAIRALSQEIRSSARVRALLSRRTKLGRAGTARQVYYKWQGQSRGYQVLQVGRPDDALELMSMWTKPV